MHAFFVGVGVMHHPVAMMAGVPLIPEVDTKVRIKGKLFKVDDVHHDYEQRQIRVYLLSV